MNLLFPEIVRHNIMLMWTEQVPGMSVMSFNETCKNQSANQQNKTIVVDFRHSHDNSHQQTTNFHDKLI